MTAPQRRSAIVRTATVRIVEIVGVGVVITAVLVVTAALALAPRTAEVPTAGPRASGSPVATSTPAPIPSSALTDKKADEKADTKAAASAAATPVAEVVTVTNKVPADPDALPRELENYTGGFVEGEIRALAAERKSLGYTQVGTAVITSITTRKAKLDGDPPTITLNVCIDSSGIDIFDANGVSLKASLYNPGHPVLNVYGAQYTGGSWKITTHALPATAGGSTSTPPDKKEPCT